MINESKSEFDTIKIKRNSQLKGVEDYPLIKMAQEDIDKDRMKCYWLCSECGYIVEYKESLAVFDSYYIHELKCFNRLKKGRRGVIRHECKSKMILIRPDNKGFDSIYFNELFARYQDRLIWESKKSFLIDSPDEVYSFLSGYFSKIVSQFAREKSFSSKSNKWFSSFFWKSIQNKIADLRKTNNYNKRRPTVKCQLCKKNVGQITPKHLWEKGHDRILKEIYLRLGLSIMDESKEILEWEKKEATNTRIEKRARFLGRKSFINKSDKEQKKRFSYECLSIYTKMFPSAILKNYIMSINKTVLDSENSCEMIDLASEGVFGPITNGVDDIYLESMIDGLVEIVLTECEEKLDKYISINYDYNDWFNLFREIIFLEVKGYGGDKTKKGNKKKSKINEVDFLVFGAKKGLTDNMFKFIKSNKKCRIYLQYSNSLTV